jgi:N-formylglutamate amidohydrolase
MDPKGVAALTDYHGRSIYQSGLAPDQATIVQRVARFHRPYHAKLEHAFEKQGFSVSLNSPYQGGYIVSHYGWQLAQQGRFAIQSDPEETLILLNRFFGSMAKIITTYDGMIDEFLGDGI